jgi:hypothetical protein
MNLDWLRRFWNFIDDRDIDKHFVALVIILGAFKVMQWSFAFAEKVDHQPGFEVAAVIASITAPLAVILPIVVNFYFKARTDP